jgi:outer membrane protein OmpA-like peptidoglycan-associated protein/tetratricopeptide (TPR) repeat protein
MKKFLALLLLAVTTGTSLFAQKALVRKGDYYYKMFAYAKAIPYYEKALKKDSTIQDAVFRLANSYRLTNNRERSQYWFAKAVSMPKCETIYKYYYAQMLMNSGKYAQAKVWMENFAVESPNDGRGQLFMRAFDTYKSFFADSSDYEITRLDINTTDSDFGTAMYNDGIVFSSNRPRTGMVERTHTWTEKPFLTLYHARGKEKAFRAPEVFDGSLQTKYNDGPVCFNKKGDEIFITRNNIDGTKVHKSKDKIVKLKIYSAKNSGGNWSELTPFQYNSNDYSCAHPALSPDGKRLYFSSDMAGGQGGMDIYVCERKGNGWTTPVNMGDTINTKGNEVFPVVMEDGTLYFSSDAHPGIGGLDIFYTREMNGQLLPVVNVGYPLNTAEDDFGMVYDAKNRIGYLSSNRLNKGFDDDVYSFKRKTIRIKGIVVNRETGDPINQATVEFTNNGNKQNFVTGENGRFEFAADFDQDYTIKGSAINMGDSTVQVSTKGTAPADPFVRIELGNPYKFAATILVTDAETHLPIVGATIKDELNDMIIGITDSAGRFRQPIMADAGMQLQVSKENYRSRVIMMDPISKDQLDDKTFNVEMKPAMHIHPYEDWYSIIYYDLDKHTIRADAAKTLDGVAIFLKEHPEVTINFSSHTDSRASASYNERLSENRSKSARRYLISKGVNAKQLAREVWNGENVLVNNCGDGAPCTEDEHQQNRRTEFTVSSVDTKPTSSSGEN